MKAAHKGALVLRGPEGALRRPAGVLRRPAGAGAFMPRGPAGVLRRSAGLGAGAFMPRRLAGALAFVLRGPAGSGVLRGLAGAAAWLLLPLLLACAALNPLGVLPGGGHDVWHEVKKGENLYRISKYYQVPVSRIMKVNQHIKNKNRIRAGQMLWIPNTKRGIQPGYPLVPPPDVLRTLRTGGGDKAGGADNAATPRFVWPARGRLSSRFGPRWGRMHEGIDIAAQRGAPVRSVADGKVIHAGRIGAYGNVVIVKHGGRFATVYAHNHRNRVRKGQRVKQSQVIAQVGATGRATGPHLHFEVRVGEKPRNPLRYLPR